MWTTMLTAIIFFGVVVLAMSVGVLFKKRTPLKEKGCHFMCKHGKDKQCACSHHPKPQRTLTGVALDVE